MIKIYCQYSYGGFKNFYIEGVENELVENEVYDDEKYGFPDDAQRYFQYGGVKILYRSLGGGKLDLLVKEISSLHTDGSGRAIPCAVQFIGDSTDRKTLDNMAVYITNNLDDFSKFFAGLFYVQEGLRIKGNELRNFIGSFDKEIEITDTMPSALKNVATKPQGVFLFVPTSTKFNVDRIVTENVCKDLNINANDVRNHFIPLAELKKSEEMDDKTDNHKKISLKDVVKVGLGVAKEIAKEHIETVKEIGKEHIGVAVETAINTTSALQNKIQELQGKINNLQSDISKEQIKNSTLKSEVEIRDRKLSFHKKLNYILAGLAGILLVSLIGHCACSGDKNEPQKHQSTETIQSTESSTNTK